jgi:hypothetical protein
MSRMHRVGLWVAVGALAGGMATTAQAQIQGMPLFTNPRYATGIRVHADLGLPTDKGTSLGSYNVLQGGATLALGPFGIGANVGMTRNDFKTVTSGAVTADVGAQTKVTASALLQLRLAGGGASPLSFSVFGGASYDINGFDFGDLSSLPQAIQDSIKGSNPKVLTIPVGGAIGFKLPLVVVTPNLWGSGRLNMTRVVDCPSGATCKTDSKFRWAVGLDIPILSILSVRAAYDSGKIGDQTVSYFGLGASIGLGGMR